MKFSCHPGELSDTLSIVSKALPSRADIPVLEGIKIVAEGDKITFTATDLEIFIERQMKADILIEGECVVSGRIFSDMVRKLADLDSVDVQQVGDKIHITYGKNKSEIQCLNLDTFPEMVCVSDEAAFTMEQRDLKEILEATSFCVSSEDSRPTLKGVYLHSQDDKMVAVAMDGFRLAIGKAPLKESNGEKTEILVPGRIMNEVAKIMTDEKEDVKIKVQRNNVQFDLGHTKVIARLMEGTYIDYNRILPANSSIKVTVNKDALENGLDRASLIARINKKTNYVKLSVRETELIIRTEADIGNFREGIPCTTQGNDLDIAFNAKFLFDAFNHIKDEMITIEFNNHNTPALIKPVEGDKFLYLVLPVRMIG